jgi:hypothetical protein
MSTPVPPVGSRNMSSLTPALLRQSVGYRLRMKQGRKSKQRSVRICYFIRLSVNLLSKVRIWCAFRTPPSPPSPHKVTEIISWGLENLA